MGENDMYSIKQLPEDFIVKEISSINSILSGNSSGAYSYYLLKKRNYTTMRAIEAVAKRLNRGIKQIGFAGTKDKRAVTEQYISIRNCNANGIEMKDISMKLVARGDEPISLGDLDGNEFMITVRNIDHIPKIPKNLRIINIFDEQRFSKNNIGIGKAILKKDFKKAVELVLENESALKGFSLLCPLLRNRVFKGEYEAAVKDYLSKKTNDYVGALRRIPRKIAMMFVHSFQSDIWNRMAVEIERMIKKKKVKLADYMVLPIIGFGTEFSDKNIEDIAIKLLKKEGITQRDFIVRQLPELSSEGNERKLYANVEGLRLSGHGDDELNEGKKKAVLNFRLPKASYATAVIKSIFSGY